MLNQKSHEAILKTLELDPVDYTHLGTHGRWEIWQTIDAETISTKIDSNSATSVYFLLRCDARYTWSCSPEEIDTVDSYLDYNNGVKRRSKF